MFDEREGVLTVKDLGSSNGTVVNGQRVTMETVLEPGDMVEIGPVLFRVDYDMVEANTVFSAPEPEPNTLMDPADSGTLGDAEPSDDEELMGDMDPITMFEQPGTIEERPGPSRTLFEAPESSMNTMEELFGDPDVSDEPPTFLDPLDDDSHHHTLFEQSDDEK